MLWFIDLAHSTIEFSVKHMVISTARGRFSRFSGAMELEENNLTLSTVSLEIETASIQTGDAGRDDHLRQPDFFDSAQYPTASFRSKLIEQQAENSYRVVGDLILHGITRQVTVQVVVEGKVKDMYGRETYIFSGITSINRRDFGLVWNKLLETGGAIVGDNVNISFNIEAQLPVAAEVGV